MNEGQNSRQKKELTLNDLAQIVTEGFGMVDKRFEKVDKKFEGIDKKFEGIDKKFEGIDKKFEESRKHTKKVIDEKIEWLARNTQDNFLSVEGKLDKVEGKLGKIETDVGEIKANTENHKAEINKKVDRIVHNDLVYRVEKLEKKFA